MNEENCIKKTGFNTNYNVKAQEVNTQQTIDAFRSCMQYDKPKIQQSSASLPKAQWFSGNNKIIILSGILIISASIIIKFAKRKLKH